ncbi:DNA primase [candidate division KSB1 bacterium]
MFIPDDKIDEIRNTVNIVDIVGSAVRLKKSGRNFVGLCPFHQEKTPSFMVNSDKQIYKCFGCGEGGNAFSFLMKNQSISFVEAVRQLAEKSGISLPEYKEKPEQKQKYEKLYAISDFASKWFVENLHNTPAGKKAFKYLTDRGYKEETINGFELGYAPDSWEGLVAEAKKASYDNETLIESGLALRKSRDRDPYDRFRNRIIFPVKNEFGRTVGFGARKFDKKEDENAPKYINSPETPVYYKGKMLYGLFQNKDLIRKKDMAILVEGYTDVMSLNEHGIGLAVATLGTSLTPQQAALINRYTKNVILLYDADAAGIKAALRGAEILFSGGLDVQVVNLGEEADPDSFLRNNSKDAFFEKLKNRQTIVEFYASGFKLKGSKLSYKEKSERIRDMIELVDSVKDDLKRELMLKEIGEHLSTDVKTIFKEYYRKKRSRSGYFQRRSTPAEIKETPRTEFDKIEKEFITLLINSPDRAEDLLSQIEKNDITDPELLKVIKIIFKFVKGKKSYKPSDIVSSTKDEQLVKTITDLSFFPYEMPDADEVQAQERMDNLTDDILKRIKDRRIDRLLNEIQDEIKKAESEGKSTSALIKKYQELLHKKSDTPIKKR